MRDQNALLYQRHSITGAWHSLVRLFDCVGTRGNELVRGVVLVGRNQQSAVEARTGLADGATERVFVAAAPARRGESRGAFIGLRPVRAVFVGGLDNAIEQGFLGASVGVGDGRVRLSLDPPVTTST